MDRYNYCTLVIVECSSNDILYLKMLRCLVRVYLTPIFNILACNFGPVDFMSYSINIYKFIFNYTS